MPAAGRIAFLSQSGALCTAVLDYAREKRIGFSKFVSFGNKAGVTEIDLFDYLHKDPQTDVILLYLEELRDGRGLIEAARRRHPRRRRQADPGDQVGPHAAGGRRGQPATPARWPARTRSATPSSARRASSASPASRRCSTRPSSTPTSRCPPATGWPSSPTPAGRASWPPTRRFASGCRSRGSTEQTTAKLKAALPATANVEEPRRRDRRRPGRPLRRGRRGRARTTRTSTRPW